MEITQNHHIIIHFVHHNLCSHPWSITSNHNHKSVHSLRSIQSTLILKNLSLSLVRAKATFISQPRVKTSHNMFGTSHTQERKALHLSSPLLTNKPTTIHVILLANSKSDSMHSNLISSLITRLLFDHQTEIQNPSKSIFLFILTKMVQRFSQHHKVTSSETTSRFFTPITIHTNSIFNKHVFQYAS